MWPWSNIDLTNPQARALGVDVSRLTHDSSIGYLDGLTIGVRQGNTGQPITGSLVAQGRPAQRRTRRFMRLAPGAP
jgi:hypothetical protein